MIVVERLEELASNQSGIVALTYLRFQDPDAAVTIESLAWVKDGLIAAENQPVRLMVALALESPRIFRALAGRAWVQDGLSPNEADVMDNIIGISGNSMATRDEAVGLSIVDMPFLETIDGVDAAAVESLHRMNSYQDRDYLRQVLSYPMFSGGITNDQAIIVAAMYYVVGDRPELLDTLADPLQTTVLKRVVLLPHTGEVTLSVIHIGPADIRTMDLLENQVRTQERFMGAPLGNNHIGLLVADATGNAGGGGRSGIITVDPGKHQDSRLIAHELAHVYWSFFPPWISEGAADFMSTISADAQFSSGECSLASNLSEWDRLIPENEISENIIYWSGCAYTLGRGLFIDLYDNLGDEAFRQGFRKLYITMRDEVYDEKCLGVERGICFVSEAFVVNASTESAAIAEPIIDLWYYGTPNASSS